MVKIETKRRYDDIFSFLFKVEQKIFDRLDGKTRDFFTVRDASFIAICLSKASRKSQRFNRVVEVFIASIQFLRVRDKHCLKTGRIGIADTKTGSRGFLDFPRLREYDASTKSCLRRFFRTRYPFLSRHLDLRSSIFDLVSFDRLTLFNVITLIRRV